MQTHTEKKQIGKFRSFLWVPVFILLVSIGAQASIRLDKESIFTLQTFFMGICYYYMPRNIRILAIILYLGFGIAGLPLFSNGRSGWEYFSQNRVLGYFIGFVVAALLKPESDHRLPNIFTYFLLLHLVVLGMGMLFIAYYEKSLDLVPDMVYALLPGLVIKSVAASLLIWLFARYRFRVNGSNAG